MSCEQISDSIISRTRREHRRTQGKLLGREEDTRRVEAQVGWEPSNQDSLVTESSARRRREGGREGTRGGSPVPGKFGS